MDTEPVKHRSSPRSSLKKATQKANILIVEDDLSLEPLWALVFKRLNTGAHYTWVTSVHEAEDLLKKKSHSDEPFDLVIADVFVSGGKTGIDLLERVDVSMTERFIFVTGTSSERLRSFMSDRWKEIPILEKPFELAQCASFLQNVLNELPLKENAPRAPDRELSND